MRESGRDELFWRNDFFALMKAEVVQMDSDTQRVVQDLFWAKAFTREGRAAQPSGETMDDLVDTILMLEHRSVSGQSEEIAEPEIS